MSQLVEAAAIPDSKLARAITEYIRDTETELLFNHSSRVYHFGALAGVHRGLKFDRELLYAGAMFHDIGLMPGQGIPGDPSRRLRPQPVLRSAARLRAMADAGDEPAARGREEGRSWTIRASGSESPIRRRGIREAEIFVGVLGASNLT
jgi:hypothetical protein